MILVVVEGDFSEQAGFSAAQKLISTQSRRRVASNDQMAVGFVVLPLTRSIATPDVSSRQALMSLPIGIIFMPSLTTMRQPIAISA